MTDADATAGAPEEQALRQERPREAQTVPGSPASAGGHRRRWTLTPSPSPRRREE